MALISDKAIPFHLHENRTVSLKLYYGGTFCTWRVLMLQRSLKCANHHSYNHAQDMLPSAKILRTLKNRPVDLQTTWEQLWTLCP